jgi:acyl carrier protein
MIVSSCTPEGHPSRCTLCGAETNLLFSDPAGDASCPNCGHLLWFSADLLSTLQEKLAQAYNTTTGRVTPDTSLVQLGGDSLDTVELVMELEEQFHLSVPDDEVKRLKTAGDAIRYIEQRKRADGST